jgi:hypothetical protein
MSNGLSRHDDAAQTKFVDRKFCQYIFCSIFICIVAQSSRLLYIYIYNTVWFNFHLRLKIKPQC